MSKSIKTILAGLAGATILAASAQAGGFGRGTADTDIIYEDGNFNFRAGVSYVSPGRGYDTLGGVNATDPDFIQPYLIPSFAVKASGYNVSCAGTYTQVYGANTVYGPQKQLNEFLNPADGNPTSSVDFSVDEFGLTCGYGMDIGPGKAWLIGGLFLEKFNYTEVTGIGTLSFDGNFELGYRLGVAYEVPEIALRGQLLYRSEVEHDPGGSFTGLVPGFLPAGVYPVTGMGTTPQSLELRLQSGIAAGTLAFANIKWTQWSSIDTLDYLINGVVPSRNEYFWKDGWTVTAGLGRQLTDKVAGSVSLTWDQGVSTTEDMLTDTWTLATGVSIKEGMSEFRFGGGVSYLTAGSQSIAQGASFDATVDGDFAFAIGGSFSVKF